MIIPHLFQIRSLGRVTTGVRSIAAGLLTAMLLLPAGYSVAAAGDLDWPEITREQKPWTYWWWMASAVDETNITKELTRYRDAGLGGVHIIPIYGARGWESNYITYLSPRWMEVLAHTVREANRLGLGVDMTTGSGWCFGGPRTTDDEANATVVTRQFEVAAGEKLGQTFEARTTQALMAFGPEGAKLDLLPRLGADGKVDWSPDNGSWRVFAISQRPSGQRVKRAGPGGEGHMLNLFYEKAVTNFLQAFEEAFANYSGPKPRAQYHDSYEYRSDWSPNLFAEFEKRRGYRLQDELPALFARSNDIRTARVKCDYRETLSELMSELTLPLWVKWSHDRGFLTRNEAHGSPGNLLDLYAVADMPETEMFHADRNKLISKFASSAAHVMGRKFTTCETGTWLEEHFTETLADMKYLLDDLFLSGVNHIFYHGTCYSPDEAPWPGWLFYASYEMNPRNSVWRDVSAINHYAARCQAALQAGAPDNDVLVYWPIHDRWSDPAGMVQPFTVHARDWFEAQPIGKAAEWLWNHGYQFDYVSDKQLATAEVREGEVRLPGGSYRAIVVPACERMPEKTLSNLLALVKSGAIVLFEEHLPNDVPGLGNLEGRQAAFRELLNEANQLARPTTLRGGRVAIGALERILPAHLVPREPLTDHPGLLCIRRKLNDGRYYFIANRGEKPVDGWVRLAVASRSAALFDPLSGRTGVAASRAVGTDAMEVYLQLLPGESILVRTFSNRTVTGDPWPLWRTAGDAIALPGTWQVKFLEGGPELPAAFETNRLGSWTDAPDPNAQRFAGTAVYTLRFDAPGSTNRDYWLDLGSVHQSARVRLNGADLGTLLISPFRIAVSELKPTGNVLEVEVTNVSANRIRDLDRRNVRWRYFHDINFVNLNYREFNAANWPLTESGLAGPVTLTPLARVSVR